MLKPKKDKSPAPKPKEDKQKLEKPKLVPNEPLRPAWDDSVPVSHRGKSYDLQVAALHTNLRAVTRTADGSSNDTGFKSVRVSLPAYETPNVQPFVEDSFRLTSQCLVHLAAPDAQQGDDLQAAADSILMFLYEVSDLHVKTPRTGADQHVQHNSSSYFSNQPPWKDLSVQNDLVRRMGPESFRSFPNHHFFVRVYRHNAVSRPIYYHAYYTMSLGFRPAHDSPSKQICAALLNRTPTFLAGPEWLSAPWELHPKSPFDRLLDLVALLPAVFHRADYVLAQEHTMSRRLMAQDLLNNCLEIELQLSSWYASLQGPSSSPSPSSISSGRNRQPQPLFWAIPASSSPQTYQHHHQPQQAHFPFSSALAFASPTIALCMIYYWTALVLLYPRIWRLYWAVYESVPEDYSNQHHDHHQHQQHHHHHHHHPAAGSSSSANTSSILPPGVHGAAAGVDPMRYGLKQVRELAANVCRALDAAVDSCAQPDMLLVPLWVAGAFWGDLSGLGWMGMEAGADEFGMGMGSSSSMASMGMGSGMGMGMGMDASMGVGMGQMGMGSMSMGMGMGMGMGGMGMGMDMNMGGYGAGDGRLEVMWCEAFRARVLARGREIQEIIQGRGWVDLASF